MNPLQTRRRVARGGALSPRRGRWTIRGSEGLARGTDLEAVEAPARGAPAGVPVRPSTRGGAPESRLRRDGEAGAVVLEARPGCAGWPWGGGSLSVGRAGRGELGPPAYTLGDQGTQAPAGRRWSGRRGAKRAGEAGRRPARGDGPARARRVRASAAGRAGAAGVSGGREEERSPLRRQAAERDTGEESGAGPVSL